MPEKTVKRRLHVSETRRPIPEGQSVRLSGGDERGKGGPPHFFKISTGKHGARIRNRKTLNAGLRRRACLRRRPDLLDRSPSWSKRSSALFPKERKTRSLRMTLYVSRVNYSAGPSTSRNKKAVAAVNRTATKQTSAAPRAAASSCQRLREDSPLMRGRDREDLRVAQHPLLEPHEAVGSPSW
jgi:hypothetical protein